MHLSSSSFCPDLIRFSLPPISILLVAGSASWLGGTKEETELGVYQWSSTRPALLQVVPKRLSSQPTSSRPLSSPKRPGTDELTAPTNWNAICCCRWWRCTHIEDPLAKIKVGSPPYWLLHPYAKPITTIGSSNRNSYIEKIQFLCLLQFSQSHMSTFTFVSRRPSYMLRHSCPSCKMSATLWNKTIFACSSPMVSVGQQESFEFLIKYWIRSKTI